MRLLKLFTLVLLLNVSLHAIVGATKGNVDVAQGNLTFNVDVLLPKGVAGLKPGLKLSYNSSNSTNSILGVGFSLEGVSLVSKCNETLFSEKQDNSRTYNYCLDGQKLLLTDEASTYGENNTQYRTKTNSQNKVLKTAQGWMVYSKDGLIKEYGYTADSKDGEAFFRINKIKDRYDNEINFTYASTNNEKQLTAITYANNRVELVYEDRSDKRMVGSYGQLSNINKRLKQIKVNSNDTLVSSYDVTYEYSHHKSRVKAITECVMGQCLEPVVFDWSEEHIGFSEFQNWGQNATNDAQYRPTYADSNQYSRFVDVNADSLPDRVHHYNYKTKQYGYWVQINNGNSFGEFENWGQNAGYDAYYRPTYADSNQYSTFIDINGDGLPDKVHYYNYKTKQYGYWVQINTGNGFTELQNWGQNTSYDAYYRPTYADSNQYSTFVDVNSDGLPDRAHYYNYKTNQYGYWVQINNGSSFGEFENWGQNTSYDAYYRPTYADSNQYSTFVDINGDGLPDRAHYYNYKTKQYGYWVQINNGNSFGEFENWGQNAGYDAYYRPTYADSNQYSTFIDINGDGLPDKVHYYNYKTSQYGYWVQINTGNGFTEFQNWGQNTSYDPYYRPTYADSNQYSTFVDINGDGLPDRAHYYNYKTNQYGYWVQINNGSSFGEFENWGQNAGYDAYYRPTYADSNQYSIFIDINGDGLPDKVHYYNYKTKQYGYWVQLNQYRPSKIVSINNNKDQTVNIEYSTLRDSDIYTAHTGASYPSLDIKASAMSVVKVLKVIDGNGQENSTTFKYEGLKVDRERGSLGFAKVYTHNDISQTKTITTFSQEYPFVGVVLNSKSYINEVLTSEQITEGLNVKKYFTNENILNLEIEKNITHKYDLDGTHLLTSISKNMQYDKYGNVQVVQSITQNADGSEVYTKTTGSVYENNEDKWILGRLTSAQVTHEGTGLANVVKSSAFVYDNDKGTLVSEVIEPNSDKQLIKQYEYDSFGNKIKESISGNNITPRSTKYLYDKQGINLVRIENALGHIESREYDIHNRVVKVTGPNNLSTQYTYDAMGRKIKEERADGTMSIWTHSWDNSIEHAMYKVTKQSTGTPPSSIYFDRANRKIRTEKVGFDGAKIYENFYYNALGQQYKSSTPHYDIDAPEYIYTTYDLSGRPLSIDKPGASGGRVTYGFEYNGLTVTETKPNGQTKVTKNNILGQKVQVTESGSVIKYAYDAFGNLIKTIDSQNNIIALTYDIYGNKVSMDDPDMGVWNYTYNALKELVSQTDAKNQTTTMQYDALGRMVQRTEAEGITYWKYDTHKYGIGKLSYVQNDNYKKEFYYDEYGRINNTKEYIEEQVYNTYLSYTADGKLETTTSPDGFETINEYNEFGFLSAVKSIRDTGSLNYSEIEAAIEENLKISMDYAKEAVQYSNDAQEKKAKSNLFLALAQETADVDIKAQLLSTSSLASQTASLLKAASNDAQEESNRALKLVNVFLKMAQGKKEEGKKPQDFYDYVTSKFREQTRTYMDMAVGNLNNAIDGLSKVTTDTALSGAYLDQEKELIDSHIEQTQRIVVTALGLSQKVLNYKTKYEESVANDHASQNSTYLSMVEDENYTYFYKILKADEFGRVTKDIVGNGLISQREYNKANGHLNFITTGYNGDNDIRDIEYEFDVMNNVTLKADKKQNITSNYTYDSLDRIKSANIISSESSMNITYAYDALGNITNKSDVGDYTYSNAHRLTAAGQYAYTYDANGNVIAKNDTTLTYSSYNKPIQIKDGSNTTEFLYAPNRARYKKVHNNDVTYYVGKLFEKEIINGKVRYKNFVYAGGNVVAIDIQEDDGALFIPSVRYLHKDALGSIDTITDESGKVVQRLSYKPFGERIVGSWQNELSGSNALTKRGFTGHEHIDEFNLIHMNGRVYDPVTGRFLSADPHIQAPYDTQSYNRYAYVKNNPLKYTDPSGFFFKKIKRFFKKVGKFFKRVVKTIKKYIRTIVAVVVAIVITVYTAGAAAGWVASWGSAFGTAATATAAATTTALGSITAGAITGAMAGFASGLIMTGSLKGAMTGALSGAIGGAIGGYYSNNWSLGRVAAQGVSGGISSELNGGSFKDGFKLSAAMALITWGARAMRDYEIKSSKKWSYIDKEGNRVYPNASGKSVGFQGDGFKLGGGRVPSGYKGPLSALKASPLGGVQGGPGSINGISYSPGSIADYVVEAYAGPHDFLNHGYWYDSVGNAMNHTGIQSFVGEALNYANVFVATPIVATSVAQPYDYLLTMKQK